MKKQDTMKELPEFDRPYEKIKKFGTHVLTDSEILAVIIRSGTVEKTALDVARELLKKFDGSISKVCDAGIAELSSVVGIGEKKACLLKAVGDASARIMRENTRKLPNDSCSPQVVGEFLAAEMGFLKTEIFRVVLLDKKLRIVGTRDVSKGILDKTLVHPREVFAPAIREQCYAIIIAHNHPSGVVEPSGDDIALTKRLYEAGELLGIPVLDHFIVGKNNYLSMEQSGFFSRIKTKISA